MHRRGRRWGHFKAPAGPGRRRLHVDHTWSPRRLSLEILRASWPWVLSAAALIMCFNVATMLIPIAIGAFIERVIMPATAGAHFAALQPALLVCGGAIALLYAVTNLAYRFGSRLGWFGVQRTQFELSQVLLERLLHPRGTSGRGRSAGELLSLSTSDVHRSCLVLYLAVYPPGELVGLAVGLTAVWWVHPVLGTAMTLALPLALSFMLLAARPLRRRSRREQQRIADTAAIASDVLSGFRVLRGIHAHTRAAARYRASSRQALGATISARSASAAFDGVSSGMAQLFAALLAIAAAALSMNGAITVGGLITVAGVAVALVEPIDALANTLGSFWTRSQASTERVLDLLSEPQHSAASGTRDAAPGATELRFNRLPLSEGATLSGTIPPGSFLVLSLSQDHARALIDSLTLTVEAPRGSLTLGGFDLSSLEPAQLRSRLVVAPHEAAIFSGTVGENVLLPAFDSDFSPHARAVLQAAGLDTDELGEDHRVGASGQRISGGQRQRIALARAIATEADVLVLFDPTTSVDAITEQRIVRNLRAHRRGKATLILASSPAFVAASDDPASLTVESMQASPSEVTLDG